MEENTCFPADMVEDLSHFPKDLLFFMVLGIEGDYATLIPILPEEHGPVPDPEKARQVALALLPEDLREGEFLVRRLLEYERCE